MISSSILKGALRFHARKCLHFCAGKTLLGGAVEESVRCSNRLRSRSRNVLLPQPQGPAGVFSQPILFSVAIGTLDGLIVVAYIAATTLLGILLGRGQTDNRDFFLAGHRLPTWALLVSIVATETSTVTFLSVPGMTFVTRTATSRFCRSPFGYIVGRLAIVVWLLPGYFRGEMLTAYQVLEQRFGVATRRLASLVFLVTRNVADGLANVPQPHSR